MTDIQKQLAEALDLANDLWSKGCTSERLVKACDLLRQQHHRITALEVELIGLRNAHRQQEARKPLSEVERTAPERIYLLVSDDAEHYSRAFPKDPHGDEITWCEDKALDCHVEYIRADLAAHGMKGE